MRLVASPVPAPAGSLAPGQPLMQLRALADPIRLRVLESLGGGERCVCELTAELELAQSRLSFHLKVLKQAGLITARQQGRWVYYRLQPDVLQSLGDWLGSLTQDCQRPAPECC